MWFASARRRSPVPVRGGGQNATLAASVDARVEGDDVAEATDDEGAVVHDDLVHPVVAAGEVPPLRTLGWLNDAD